MVCTVGAVLKGWGLHESTWPWFGAGALVKPYADACSPDVIAVEEVDRLVNLFTIAFLRRHLRGEAEYEGYLSEAFARGEAMATLRVR
jgi:hypothetical protein